MSDKLQVNQDLTAPKMLVALPFPDLHEKSVVQASYDCCKEGIHRDDKDQITSVHGALVNVNVPSLA